MLEFLSAVTFHVIEKYRFMPKMKTILPADRFFSGGIRFTQME